MSCIREDGLESWKTVWRVAASSLCSIKILLASPRSFSLVILRAGHKGEDAQRYHVFLEAKASTDRFRQSLSKLPKSFC